MDSDMPGWKQVHSGFPLDVPGPRRALTIDRQRVQYWGLNYLDTCFLSGAWRMREGA